VSVEKAQIPELARRVMIDSRRMEDKVKSTGDDLLWRSATVLKRGLSGKTKAKGLLGPVHHPSAVEVKNLKTGRKRWMSNGV
jgi:hypothetical protein